MTNAIELHGLTKEYPGFRLGSLDLTLPSGSIMGLVGENGAGKSTTIKLIMNAVRRDSGIVSVLGVDNQSAAFHAAKEDIGIVLDEAYFPEVLNANDVGRIMANTYRQWEPETYESYLQRFGLPRNKAFKDFSRGMKMKLAIAVALSHQAKLLILDEATSGLDPMVRDEILDIFNEYTRQERRTAQHKRRYPLSFTTRNTDLPEQTDKGKSHTAHYPAKADKIQRAVGICAGNRQSGDAAFEGEYLLMQVIGDHQQKQYRRDDRQYTGSLAQAVVLWLSHGQGDIHPQQREEQHRQIVEIPYVPPRRQIGDNAVFQRPQYEPQQHQRRRQPQAVQRLPLDNAPIE